MTSNIKLIDKDTVKALSISVLFHYRLYKWSMMEFFLRAWLKQSIVWHRSIMNWYRSQDHLAYSVSFPTPLHCEIFNKIWSHLCRSIHLPIGWLLLYDVFRKSAWFAPNRDVDRYRRRSIRYAYHDHIPKRRRESRNSLRRAAHSPSLSGALQYQYSARHGWSRYPLW